MTSPSNSIFAKLIKAQACFANISKDKEAAAFGSGKEKKMYAYADISSVLQLVRPILNANGLAVIQRTKTEVDAVSVETILYDEEGNSLESGAFRVPTKDLIQRGPQAFGSAVTYARRYSLVSFLGLSYGDNDDDGNLATKPYWEAASKQKTKPAPKPAPPPKPDPAHAKQVADLKAAMDGADTLEALASIANTISQASLDEGSAATLRAYYKKRHAELNK